MSSLIRFLICLIFKTRSIGVFFFCQYNNLNLIFFCHTATQKPMISVYKLKIIGINLNQVLVLETCQKKIHKCGCSQPEMVEHLLKYCALCKVKCENFRKIPPELGLSALLDTKKGIEVVVISGFATAFLQLMII